VTCGSLVTADAIVNVALFIPAGVGLALLSRRTGASIVLLALASGAIEVAQFLVVPGRDAALRDVLANTLGAAAGVEAVRQWRLWLLPVSRRAGALALAAAALWVAALGATVGLSRPSIPFQVYFGQRGNPPEFTGHVERVRLNGADIRLGVLQSEAVVDVFNNGDPRVEVVFVPGLPSGASQPVARISNEQTGRFACRSAGTICCSRSGRGRRTSVCARRSLGSAMPSSRARAGTAPAPRRRCRCSAGSTGASSLSIAAGPAPRAPSSA
jgi:hypothetical protein